jgi:hypothetical protein
MFSFGVSTDTAHHGIVFQRLEVPTNTFVDTTLPQRRKIHCSHKLSTPYAVFDASHAWDTIREAMTVDVVGNLFGQNCS